MIASCLDNLMILLLCHLCAFMQSHYLAGNGRTLILTWEHRMQISISIARGLCFLHANALAKMVHGDLKVI